MKVFRDKSHFICFGYFAATITDPNLRLIYSANKHFVNAIETSQFFDEKRVLSAKAKLNNPLQDS